VVLNRSNQITGNVTVLASGLLNFAGFSDTIGTLSIAAGPTFSGRIDLNGGTLALGGNLSQTSAGGTFTTLSPSAKIEDGILSLGGANRTFTTADAGFNIRELQIDAVISGGISSQSVTTGGTNTNERHRLTFAISPTAAAVFSLNYAGDATADITYGAFPAAAAAAIQTALQALSGIGTVVTGGVAVIEQTAGVAKHHQRSAANHVWKCARRKHGLWPEF